jgi:hypothetical protein
MWTVCLLGNFSGFPYGQNRIWVILLHFCFVWGIILLDCFSGFGSLCWGLIVNGGVIIFL